MQRLLFFLLLFTAMSTNAQQRVASKGIAAHSNHGDFKQIEFTRHPVGDNDILIDILYAGICHSDIHHVFGHWKSNEPYPYVPGHEIVGVVRQVGKNVTKFNVGDYAGVGCLVNACGTCSTCSEHQEQYCDKRVLTYAQADHYHHGELTQGGYSNNIVLSADFAIKVPKNADLKRVAPLLCAGITTYSPIDYLQIGKGHKVGIAGFGGLGHMAVQYAVKRGAEVTVFDRTEDKRADALAMGAMRYVNVNNPQEWQGLNGSLDYVVNTISASHDANQYVKMLTFGGQMAYVGLPAMNEMPQIAVATLVFESHRKVFGSQIGGIRQTQEMLDYSVANGIYPQVEVIAATPEAVEAAFGRVVEGTVKFRYVIDMKTIQ